MALGHIFSLYGEYLAQLLAQEIDGPGQRWHSDRHERNKEDDHRISTSLTIEIANTYEHYTEYRASIDTEKFLLEL